MKDSYTLHDGNCHCAEHFHADFSDIHLLPRLGLLKVKLAVVFFQKVLTCSAWDFLLLLSKQKGKKMLLCFFLFWF